MPSAEDRSRVRPRHRAVLAGAMTLALLAFGLAASAAPSELHHEVLDAHGATALGRPSQLGALSPTREPAPEPVRPTGLSIPAIEVDESTIVPLNVLPSGQLAAPADFARIGWYVGGVAPGDPGVAVLAGHVDSRAGPAVFFRLRELKPGDQITVRRSDTSTVDFSVDAVRRYAKSAFPTEEVYGPAPGASLRLITCGGSFDAARRSYRDNIVVFASMHWTGL